MVVEVEVGVDKEEEEEEEVPKAEMAKRCRLPSSSPTSKHVSGSSCPPLPPPRANEQKVKAVAATLMDEDDGG